MKKIMLVTNDLNSLWHPVVAKAVASIGELQAVTMPQLRESLQKGNYDLIIADTSGIMEEVANLVGQLHTHYPKTPIFVVTTSPTWRRAREAFVAGAADYSRRTFDKEELLQKCLAVLDRQTNAPP